MYQYFTENEAAFVSFKSLLASPQRVVITMHQNPDGDAMGSAMGLAGILIQGGHEVDVIPPTDFPDFLRWMPNQSLITQFEGPTQGQAKQKIAAANVLFLLDFSHPSRLKDMAAAVEASAATRVLIDHHEQPAIRADFVYWNQGAAATCELVHELMVKTYGHEVINADVAACLYTGLVTDTGSFRFPATSPHLHETVAALLRTGFRHDLVHRKLFDTQTFSRLRLVGYALSEKLVYLPEYRTAYMSLSKEELSRFSSQMGDTEGLVNYGLTIQGVVMAALFTEKDDAVRISFRSVDDFSVSELARGHFNGGGHFNAAGGRSELSLEATIAKFVSLLPDYQQKLLAQP